MTRVDAPGGVWLGTAEFLKRMARVGSREGLALLRNKGMPHRKGKNGFEYPWPDAGEWYYVYLETNARGETPDDFDAARARKMSADADLAELELQKQRGEVLEVADVAAEVERVMDGLRAGVLSIRAKFAPQLIGIDSMPAASALLDAIATDLLETLSGGGDSESPGG